MFNCIFIFFKGKLDITAKKKWLFVIKGNAYQLLIMSKVLKYL